MRGTSETFRCTWPTAVSTIDPRCGLAGGLREQVLQVERQGDHVHALAVRRAFPAVAGSVGVDLDAEPVGIAQVERLGDAVVGSAVDRPAGARNAPHGGGERGSRGVKPGDVEEPGARRRRGSGIVDAR